MPAISRWFVKTSLVYLVMALVAGLLLAAQGLGGMEAPFSGLFPVYFHLLAEGWLTLLIVGVAIWMFPPLSLQMPRGNETLSWACYLLLNGGLLLRILSEPLNSAVAGGPGSLWGVLLAAGAVLQWLGGIAFVVNIWARVKAK